MQAPQSNNADRLPHSSSHSSSQSGAPTASQPGGTFLLGIPSPFSAPIQAARKYLERQRSDATRAAGGPITGAYQVPSAEQLNREQLSREQQSREQDRRLERSLYAANAIEIGSSFDAVDADEELQQKAGQGGPGGALAESTPAPEVVRGAIQRLARESELARSRTPDRTGGGASALQAVAAAPAPLDFAEVARHVWREDADLTSEGGWAFSVPETTYGAKGDAVEKNNDALSNGAAVSLDTSSVNVSSVHTSPGEASPGEASPGEAAKSETGDLARPVSGQSGRQAPSRGSLGIAPNPQEMSVQVSREWSATGHQPADAALLPPPASVSSVGCAEEGPALAHDARNLLLALGLYSDLLRMPGVLHEEHRHYAEELHLMAKRSQSLIDRLLRVAAGPAEAAQRDDPAPGSASPATHSGGDAVRESSVAVLAVADHTVSERGGRVNSEVGYEVSSYTYEMPLNAIAGSGLDRTDGTDQGAKRAEFATLALTAADDGFGSQEMRGRSGGNQPLENPSLDNQPLENRPIEDLSLHNRPPAQYAAIVRDRSGQPETECLLATAVSRFHSQSVSGLEAAPDVDLDAALETDLDSRDHGAAPHTVSLVDLLMRWGSLLSTLAHGNLEVAFGPHAAALVPATSDALERILVNLVRNAKAATAAGGAIRITAGVAARDSEAMAGRADQDGLRETMVLRVDDSGCGMTHQEVRRALGGEDYTGLVSTNALRHDALQDEDREGLPEEYLRWPGSGRYVRASDLDAALSDGPPSIIRDGRLSRAEDNARVLADGRRRCGLGLRIVRELVAASGGTLGIESWPGRGTRVEIRWPVTLPGVSTGVPVPGPEEIGSSAQPVERMAWAAGEAFSGAAAETPPELQPEPQPVPWAARPAIGDDSPGPDGFSEAELRAMMLRLHRSVPGESASRLPELEDRLRSEAARPAPGDLRAADSSARQGDGSAVARRFGPQRSVAGVASVEVCQQRTRETEPAKGAVAC